MRHNNWLTFVALPLAAFALAGIVTAGAARLESSSFPARPGCATGESTAMARQSGRKPSRSSSRVVRNLLGEKNMLDEIDRLRSIDSLKRLLMHYARLGVPDRKLWQNRLMTADGLESRELNGLHGELLAHGWLEQNTGATPPGPDAGQAAGCYRITTAGVRALEEAETVEE